MPGVMRSAAARSRAPRSRICASLTWVENVANSLMLLASMMGLSTTTMVSTGLGAVWAQAQENGERKRGEE
jgi:hypothetical protein